MTSDKVSAVVAGIVNEGLGLFAKLLNETPNTQAFKHSSIQAFGLPSSQAFKHLDFQAFGHSGMQAFRKSPSFHNHIRLSVPYQAFKKLSGFQEIVKP